MAADPVLALVAIFCDDEFHRSADLPYRQNRTSGHELVVVPRPSCRKEWSVFRTEQMEKRIANEHIMIQ